MTEPLALTLEAAADVLSVSPRTIRRLLDAGELGRVKIGRAVRVSAASLQAYVARQTEGGAAGAAQGGILDPCAKDLAPPARPLAEPQTAGRRPAGGSSRRTRQAGARKPARTPPGQSHNPAARALAQLLSQPLPPRRGGG